jgi:[acyl-carrier-protein] S-malonyltransferase
MKKRALLFSGQGAQVVGMGADLVEKYAGARSLYDEADKLLGFSLSEVSFKGPEDKLTNTSICQPALYVHGLALLAGLKAEIPTFHFTAVAGLSLGEYTAHAVAETFDFVTGLALVQKRGSLMAHACEATDGGMLALVGATKDQAVLIAKEADLDTANFNCPGQIVLSGASSHIPNAVKIAAAHGVKRAIPLKVAGAYHSRLMLSAEHGMAPHLEKAPIKRPTLPVIANFNADFVSTTDDVRNTLRRQITGSVRWEQSLRTLMAVGVEEFIELGPGGVIAGHIARIDSNLKCRSIASVKDIEKHAPELAA